MTLDTNSIGFTLEGIRFSNIRKTNAYLCAKIDWFERCGCFIAVASYSDR